MENQISMLPQPTRATGSVMRVLNEVSESDHNTRNAMPPPSSTTATGLKRQGSNLPEPARPSQKRKTLVERAGEPSRPQSAMSSTSLDASATSQYAPNSLYRSSSSASTLSRTNSYSSRSTSNSSYTGSLTSGIRPPSINSGTSTVRPKSSFANEKFFGAGSRPKTSIANLQASHEAHANKSKNPSLPNYGPRTMTHMPPPFKPSSMMDSRSRNSKIKSSVISHPRGSQRGPSFTTGLTAQLSQLHLTDARPKINRVSSTPSKGDVPSRIPRAPPAPAPTVTPTHDPFVTPRLRHKATVDFQKFLTPFSTIESFDPDIPYQDWKRMFDDSKQMIEEAVTKFTSAKEESNSYRDQLNQVEQEKTSQHESLITLKTENRTLQYKISDLEKAAQVSKQEIREKIDGLRQDHRTDIDTMRQQYREEADEMKSRHREELKVLKQQHDEELSRERIQKIEALSQVSNQGILKQQQHDLDLLRKDQDVATVQAELDHMSASLVREKQLNDDLRTSLRNAGESVATMELARQGLQAKIDFLESDNKSQSEAYAAMEERMNEAIVRSERTLEKLRKEEVIRRRLHNQIQELKGNIRVYCRVRPSLHSSEDAATIRFPDELEEATQIEVRGKEEKSALGKDVTRNYPYTFDRVFSPKQANQQVCHEISGLIDSAMDGYNVCIFAYGQTGSGKTHTMMSSDDGVIPMALRQIYDRRTDQEELGWSYTMHGSFLEVYNEEIRDLLGDDSSKKHDVHHDLQTNETTVTNTTLLSLDSRLEVESMISQAMARRSVAATKANEQSSRSHSVFILKLTGKNKLTGQQTKGTLNLVDLAGSERIKNADTSGQRLKETQSINKSLSCLGDVIGALGQGPSGTDVRSSTASARDSLSTAHIPYRNSKLTYLLQLSLGGNCKTLMFVMVAPEERCLGETLTSLKFAEKVSRTKVGVAKRVK